MLNNAPGSRVIICTDGLANVGIGNLETKDRAGVASVYQRMAEVAKKQVYPSARSTAALSVCFVCVLTCVRLRALRWT